MLHLILLLIGLAVILLAIVSIKLGNRIYKLEIKEINRGKWFKGDLEEINKRIDSETEETTKDFVEIEEVLAERDARYNESFKKVDNWQRKTGDVLVAIFKHFGIKFEEQPKEVVIVKDEKEKK